MPLVAPTLKVLRLHASNVAEQAAQRQEMAENAAGKYDVIVTTYEMVKVPVLMHMFNRLHFRYVVLDEGHKIKSGITQIAQAVRKLHCENRLLLTGTPLQVRRYNGENMAVEDLCLVNSIVLCRTVLLSEQSCRTSVAVEFFASRHHHQLQGI